MEINKDLIINYYNKGKTIAQISRDLDLSRWSITNILVKNGIEIRGKPRIIYNENFFIKESNELYYFWGFVLGDGNLTRKKVL